MRNLWKNIQFAWIYAREQKWKLLGFALCNFVYIGISIVTPILGARIIVNLTDNHLRQVVMMAGMLCGIEMLRNLVNFLCNYFSQIIYRETFTKLQLDFGKAILKLQNSCIDMNSSGVFIQRFTNDTSKIADVFNLLNFHLSDVLKDIGVFTAVFIIDIRVFVYMVFMILIVGILEGRRVSLWNQRDKTFRKENEKVSGFIGELVRGVRDIKMLHAEKSFLGELQERLILLNGKRYDMSSTNRNYRFLIGNLRDFFDLTLICLLVYLIYINQMEVAIALVVRNYMSEVSHIVNNYSYLLEGLKDFNLSTGRIFEIIHGEDYPKEKFGKKHLDKVKGNFEFQDVCFEYDSGQQVLKKLSFKVSANTTVAFVGKSGAGKTTVFSLLCKMYEPQSGTILMDGVDISELDLESIRDNITVISQNPYIFNVSIRDNLRLVKEDLTEEEMIKACKAACLDDFIESLPNRYDTIVGESGISLSGGQRQRLAIARALVQKTEIILFDEATSALDNETQTKIQEAIERLQKNYTILIIAHRLSTIVHADRILFLNDGKVQAEGSHEELLKNCLDYKKLYEAEIEK